MLENIVQKTDGCLEGIVQLKSWNDFFETSCEITLNIGGDEGSSEITSMHENAFVYLLENQAYILKNILNTLFQEYPYMQEEYDYTDEEKEKFMPNIETPLEFKKLLKPKYVYLLNVAKDNMSYIGIHFACSWDQEQEFGIMMSKNKIVSLGGADTAFLSWIAEEDLEKE